MAAGKKTSGRSGKEGKINPEVYLCAAQTSLYPVPLADFAVRTAGDPRALLHAISREIWAIDQNQRPVSNSRLGTHGGLEKKIGNENGTERHSGRDEVH